MPEVIRPYLLRKNANGTSTATTQHWYDETGLTLDTGTTGASYLRTPGSGLVSMHMGGATYTYGCDRLGSVTALVNGAGALTNSYSYTAYGYLRVSMGTVRSPHIVHIILHERTIP